MLVQRLARRGMTMIELVVVVGILALLASLAVPKLIAVYEKSRSATQAYSLTDTARMIETFYAVNLKYPDGWDTLTADGGTLYSKLAPNVQSPNTLLTTASLTDEQLDSLHDAGIGHAFLHDEAAADVSSSGTDRRHFGDGTGHDGTENIRTFAVVDTSDGSDGLDMLINQFGMNSNRSAGDTSLPRISNNVYVVFGLGPKSTAVQGTVSSTGEVTSQGTLQNAPLLQHQNASTTYSRPLVVFEVSNTGRYPARLIGVCGPDGRTSGKSIGDFNTAGGAQPH